MQARLAASSTADYLAKVVACRTSNTGIFAIKVFPWHLRAAGLDLDGLLAILPGAKHLIHLSREDVDAQAISALVASQSGVWQHEQRMQQRLKYRPLQIKRLRSRLQQSADYWQSAFADRMCKPTAITYEALRDDTDAALRKIQSAVGVPFSREAIGLPELPRVALSTKREWLQRWREEAA